MSSADRLLLVSELTARGRPRWSISWNNRGVQRDLYIVTFHPAVPEATVQAVLALLKSDEHLQRVLK